MLKTTVTDFPKRALNACYDSFIKGCYSPNLVKNVLKYKTKLDVSNFDQFLVNKNAQIRKGSIEIICEYGDCNKLMDYIKYEKELFNVGNVCFALDLFVRHKSILANRCEELVYLLTNYSNVIAERAIESFRQVGREDLLLGLMFEPDDLLIHRIKKYMESQGSKVKK